MRNYKVVGRSRSPATTKMLVLLIYICYILGNGAHGYYTRAFFGRRRILQRQSCSRLASYSGSGSSDNGRDSGSSSSSSSGRQTNKNRFFSAASGSSESGSGQRRQPPSSAIRRTVNRWGPQQQETIIVEPGEPVAPSSRRDNSDRRKRVAIRPADQFSGRQQEQTIVIDVGDQPASRKKQTTKPRQPLTAMQRAQIAATERAQRAAIERAQGASIERVQSAAMERALRAETERAQIEAAKRAQRAETERAQRIQAERAQRAAATSTQRAPIIPPQPPKVPPAPRAPIIPPKPPTEPPTPRARVTDSQRGRVTDVAPRRPTTTPTASINQGPSRSQNSPYFGSWDEKNNTTTTYTPKNTNSEPQATVEDAATLVEQMDADDLWSLVMDACKDEDVLAMAQKEFIHSGDDDPEGEEAIASVQRLLNRARGLEQEAERARKPYKEIRELKALRLDLETELEMTKADVNEQREKRRKTAAEKAFYQALASSGYSFYEPKPPTKPPPVKFATPTPGTATAAATAAKAVISQTTSQQLDKLSALLDPSSMKNLTDSEIAAHFVKLMGAATFLSGEAALNGVKALVDGLFFSREVSAETRDVMNKLVVMFETARKARQEKAEQGAAPEQYVLDDDQYFLKESKKMEEDQPNNAKSPVGRYMAIKDRVNNFLQDDTIQSAGDFVGSIGRTARVAVESVKGQQAAQAAVDAAKKATEGWRKGVIAGYTMGTRSVKADKKTSNANARSRPIYDGSGASINMPYQVNGTDGVYGGRAYGEEEDYGEYEEYEDYENYQEYEDYDANAADESYESYEAEETNDDYDYSYNEYESSNSYDEYDTYDSEASRQRKEQEDLLKQEEEHMEALMKAAEEAKEKVLREKRRLFFSDLE